MGQRGLTLVELLISLVIGLVVLAAGGAVYVYSGRSSRVSNVGTQLNEDGVLAMNFLQSQIRQAGYSQKAIKNSQGALFRGAAIRGCSGGFKKNKLTAGYREAYADTICESPMPPHLAIPRRMPCWRAMRPMRPTPFPTDRATRPIATGKASPPPWRLL